MTVTSEALADTDSSAESSAGSSESGGDSLLRRLAEPTDIAGLIVGRIALGLAVASFAFGFLSSSALEHDFIAPAMHLKYHGFGWVRVWPGDGMHYHFVVMMLAGLGVALGLFYRVAAVVLFVTFTHVFLAERAIYNNHYYLISLLTFLICFMPLHRAFSLDVLRRGQPASRTIPIWTLWLFRFQLGIVYFYGGIAKLNADWLSGQPMRLWLAAQTH